MKNSSYAVHNYLSIFRQDNTPHVCDVRVNLGPFAGHAQLQHLPLRLASTGPRGVEVQQLVHGRGVEAVAHLVRLHGEGLGGGGVGRFLVGEGDLLQVGLNVLVLVAGCWKEANGKKVVNRPPIPNTLYLSTHQALRRS